MTITNTTGPSPAVSIEQVDPASLLVDLNVRLDARLDPAFCASIKDLGVLVPIVAVRTAEGQLRVRFGHRRTLAAVEAGAATVPVVVAADEATTDTASVERLVGQWAENEHRTGLTNAERVGVIEQLAAFGVSAAQIVKRTRATRTDVDAALSVARSDLAKAATLRYECLDLVQAAVVADFEDDPETVKALVAAASTGQFEHVAQRARDERGRTQRRRAFAAELGEQGITVIDDTDATPLHRLTDAEGTDLDDAAHGQCPGHAATITRRYGPIDAITGRPVADEDDGEDLRDEDVLDEEEGEEPGTVWGEYPSAVFVCTDPEGNGHTVRYLGYGYDSGATKPKIADMTEADAEAARAQRRDVIESNKAWRATEPVRREWLRGLLARKTPPKGSAALVAIGLACDADTVTRIGGNHLAAELLGCERSGYGRNSALTALVDRASEPRAQVLGLAVVLAGYEDATHTGSWRHVDPATRRYLTYLADCGYVLADVERRACGQDPLPET
jgi:ParB family transcriptional regulator, chromosome partitioning protein